ncbi:MAG TPA: hypothetical protein VJ959_00255 [Desulfotignum sp.]|nr:hypothetical protein [Desulfotignum sp.]
MEGKKWLNTKKKTAIWWLICIAGGSEKDIRCILLPNFKKQPKSTCGYEKKFIHKGSG